MYDNFIVLSKCVTFYNTPFFYTLKQMILYIFILYRKTGIFLVKAKRNGNSTTTLSYILLQFSVHPREWERVRCS